MNNNDEEALSSVYKKIQRERALLNAANQMRQQTQNEQVKSRLDTQMREGRRNIQYLEERMAELQVRTENRTGSAGSSGGPGRPPSTGAGLRSDRDGPPPTPPKDARGNYIDQSGADSGGYGTQDYSQIGGHGDMMPPRHPFAPPGPGSSMPKSRPNFTKLGKFLIDSVA
jgi:hypothetical protein